METRGPHRGNDPHSATTQHSANRAGSGRSTVLLDRPFGRSEIAEVRHQVTARLIAAGLTGDRLDGYVLAVNEVITNVVLHGGGQGRLVLRIDRGTAHCVVGDAGPGLPDDFRAAPPTVPATTAVGGRGIWLAHQLCDEVTMESGEVGTVVGLRLAIVERETRPDWVERASRQG
ncbi:MAG TPA: ATP-binding protein [Actinoplanes sp.]|nr:ATP-binding protein [Actinoplanes sp.]